MKEDDAVKAFIYLPEPKTHLEDIIVNILEEFLNILLYDMKSARNNSHAIRKDLFCNGNLHISMCPLRAPFYLQHIQRAAHQAKQIWGNAISNTSVIASLTEWEWNGATPFQILV